ncbi:hypothetical protein TRM7557_02158 [Tritonibacter multivorans]|uniref:DUF3887 domain-containing protein n=1 Tax=Tritonibacter multivorans TaxID=928856 RepID=A0A0P1GVE0_9RHOB|nr:hypothetical protein [Tritonibacter multivorans]MDA7421316.1 hypothetical protein [Tritonibacter multivorans]CUH79015.1 hypothetical protein TRM7557_02158 [Tritonibacter multivorans]SFD26242.1 hypothetical protein SAMN04488049_11027 [Tritonibacter multivorans]
MKKFFGYVLKALGVIALLVIIFICTVLFSSRQEKQITRDFFALVAEQKFEDAHDLFAPALKAEYPLLKLRTDFENMAAFTVERFLNIKASTSEGIIMKGQLSTQTGCRSHFDIQFWDEEIVAFWVHSPCMSQDRAT